MIFIDPTSDPDRQTQLFRTLFTQTKPTIYSLIAKLRFVNTH